MKKVVGRLLQKARSSWRKAHHKDKDHHHHEEDASFQTHHDDEASMDIDDDHDNHLVLTTSQSRVSRVSTTTMEDDDNLEEEDDHDHHHHHHEVPMCLAGHSSGDWSHDSQEPEHRVSLRRCLSSSNALSRRPSTIQCNKAIALLLVHMMEGDVQRPSTASYDFTISSLPHLMPALSQDDSSMIAMDDSGYDCHRGDSQSIPALVDFSHRYRYDEEEEEKEMETLPEPEEVSEFLDVLYKSCKWSRECNIMAFVLLVRLLQYNTGMILHSRNWRSVLLISLMVAQKALDDGCLKNKDFPMIWSIAAPQEPPLTLAQVNDMERHFLRMLDHHLYVAPTMFNSVYIELCSLVATSASHQPRPTLWASHKHSS